MIQNQLKKKHFILTEKRGLILFFLVLLGTTSCKNEKISEIDLSGTWEVKLDSTNVGSTDNWANTKLDGTQITLP